MKKLFTVLLSMALSFSMVACAPVLEETKEPSSIQTEKITDSIAATPAPTTVPTTKSTAAPTTAPTTKPTTAPTTVPTVSTEAVHIHSWKAATCTAPKTCSSCGATEAQANGHTWKEATYSAPKTCTVCNATEGNALEKPGEGNYHGHVYTGGSSSKKYHYEEKCPGKNSHEITWEEVERRNLGPCGTCVLK